VELLKGRFFTWKLQHSGSGGGGDGDQSKYFDYRSRG